MSRHANENALYWIPDDTEVWTLGALTGTELPNGCVQFSIVHSKKVVTKDKNLCHPYHEYDDADGTFDDLAALPNVNPASILHATKHRFQQRKIYSSCGSVILSINPFEKIKSLYGEEVMRKYIDPFGEGLPAHLYLIPSRAYLAFCNSSKNQAILISGESGAGKTEAAKECLSFLTKVNVIKRQGKGEGQQEIDVASRILNASEILESFGNSVTSRNSNSSRFGKWMEINFDSFNNVHRSTIYAYLLEKSRVTKQLTNERNYHIFYQLLRGLSFEELDTWKIFPETFVYRYLPSEMINSTNLPFDDAKKLHDTIHAFKTCGFTLQEIFSLFKIVAGVLLLGNIDFLPADNDEACAVSTSDPSMEWTANILSIPIELFQHSLINRTIESGIRKSVINIKLNVVKASSGRDTLARGIYERLFHFIIATLNERNNPDNSKSLNGPINMPFSQEETTESTMPSLNERRPSMTGLRCIGLLDIFGFEILEKNSFEQLCINYCNEILQSQFNYVVFTAEKELYSFEGITCDTIDSKDNIVTIKEIEGMFKSLDDEGKLPKGSSKAWYDKSKKNAKPGGVVSFIQKRETFVISHYAAKVEYFSDGFLEKNIETLTNELVNMMMNSTDPIINRLFGSVLSSPGNNAMNSEDGANSVMSSPSHGNVAPSGLQRSASKRYSFTEDSAGEGNDSNTHYFPPTNNDTTGISTRPPGRLLKQASMFEMIDGDGLSPLVSPSASASQPPTPALMKRTQSMRGNSQLQAAGISSPSNANTQSRSQSMNTKTISWTFKTQLTSLMEMLKMSDNHFIRCVKSNSTASPFVYDNKLVNNQLAYSGVYEVVKIQQSGLPCRVSFQDFLQRYKCLAPSRNRHRLKNPSDLIDYLRPYFHTAAAMKFGNHASINNTGSGTLSRGSFGSSQIDSLHLLNHCQQGKTMVFMKSSEQHLLEVTRKNLLFQSSTIVCKYYRRSLYNRAYRKLVENVHRFDQDIISYDLNDAELVYQSIFEICDHVDKLQGRMILHHLPEDIYKNLERLRLQVQLLNQLESLYQNRSFQSLLTLQTLLPKAIELDLSKHQLIYNVSQLIHRFKIAKEIIDNIKESDTNIMKYSVHDLENGMENIKEFEHVIPDGFAIYQQLMKYMIDVENEMTNLYQPLHQAFQQSFIYYDEITCSIVPLKSVTQSPRRILKKTSVSESSKDHPGADKTSESLDLAQIMKNYESKYSNFLCLDTKRLYEECQAFLKLRDYFVAIDDHQGLLDYLNYDLKQSISTATVEFQQQIQEFRSWADLELSITIAVDALNAFPVPNYYEIGDINNSYHNLHRSDRNDYSSSSERFDPQSPHSQLKSVVKALSYLENLTILRRLNDKFQSLSKPTQNLRSLSFVISRITNLRVAYYHAVIDDDWSDLINQSSEYMREVNDNPDVADHYVQYSQARLELNSCCWQTKCHELTTKMRSISDSNIIQQLSFDSIDWSVLTINSKETDEILESLRTFTENECNYDQCPELCKCYPLLRDLHSLRRILSEKDYQTMKIKLRDFESSYSTQYRRDCLMQASVDNEIQRMQIFVRLLEYEALLNRSLTLLPWLQEYNFETEIKTVAGSPSSQDVVDKSFTNDAATSQTIDDEAVCFKYYTEVGDERIRIRYQQLKDSIQKLKLALYRLDSLHHEIQSKHPEISVHHEQHQNSSVVSNIKNILASGAFKLPFMSSPPRKESPSSPKRQAITANEETKIPVHYEKTTSEKSRYSNRLTIKIELGRKLLIARMNLLQNESKEETSWHKLITDIRSVMENMSSDIFTVVPKEALDEAKVIVREFYLRWLIHEYKSILAQSCFDNSSIPNQPITVNESTVMSLQKRYEDINRIVLSEVRQLPLAVLSLQRITISALDMRIYAMNNQLYEAMNVKQDLDDMLFPKKRIESELKGRPVIENQLSPKTDQDRNASSSTNTPTKGDALSNRVPPYPGLLSDMIAVNKLHQEMEVLNHVLIELSLLKCWTIQPHHITNYQTQVNHIIENLNYSSIERSLIELDVKSYPNHQRAMIIGEKILAILKKIRFHQIGMIRLADMEDIKSEYELFKIDTTKIDFLTQYIRHKQYLKLLIGLMDEKRYHETVASMQNESQMKVDHRNRRKDSDSDGNDEDLENASMTAKVFRQSRRPSLQPSTNQSREERSDKRVRSHDMLKRIDSLKLSLKHLTHDMEWFYETSVAYCDLVREMEFALSNKSKRRLSIDIHSPSRSSVSGLPIGDTQIKWLNLIESAQFLEEVIEENLNQKKEYLIQVKRYNDEEVNIYFKLIQSKIHEAYKVALILKEKEERKEFSKDLEFVNIYNSSETRKESINPLKRSQGIERSTTVNPYHPLEQVKEGTEEQMIRRKKHLRSEDDLNPYGISQLRKVGYRDNEIIETKIPLKYLWAYDFDVSLLRRHGFNDIAKLVKVGYTCSQLFRGGFSVNRLKEYGFTAQEFYNAGATIDHLKYALFSEWDILTAGFPVQTLRDAGYAVSVLVKYYSNPEAVFEIVSGNDQNDLNDRVSGIEQDPALDDQNTRVVAQPSSAFTSQLIRSLLTRGFNLKELRENGFTIHQLRQAQVPNLSIVDLLSAGYHMNELRVCGFDPLELIHSHDLSYRDLIDLGFDDDTLLNNGFAADVERTVLEEFYMNLNGKFWKNQTNWLSNRSITHWAGISTEIDEKLNIPRVTEIDMTNNNLSGVLISRLGSLKRLKILIISDNNIRGDLPEELLHLECLELVNVENNLNMNISERMIRGLGLKLKGSQITLAHLIGIRNKDGSVSRKSIRMTHSKDGSMTFVGNPSDESKDGKSTINKRKTSISSTTSRKNRIRDSSAITNINRSASKSATERHRNSIPQELNQFNSTETNTIGTDNEMTKLSSRVIVDDVFSTSTNKSVSASNKLMELFNNKALSSQAPFRTLEMNVDDSLRNYKAVDSSALELRSTSATEKVSASESLKALFGSRVAKLEGNSFDAPMRSGPLIDSKDDSGPVNTPMPETNTPELRADETLETSVPLIKVSNKVGAIIRRMSSSSMVSLEATNATESTIRRIRQATRQSPAHTDRQHFSSDDVNPTQKLNKSPRSPKSNQLTMKVPSPKYSNGSTTPTTMKTTISKSLKQKTSSSESPHHELTPKKVSDAITETVMDRPVAISSSSVSGGPSRLDMVENIECEALMALYNSTNGSRWKCNTNWGMNVPLSKWHGITVNKLGHVIKIELPNNRLHGVLPNIFDMLLDLKVLDLRLNNLYSALPPTICQCRNLTHLHVHSNALSGPIPSKLGNLSQLLVLDLRSNQFSGLLPASIVKLKALNVLALTSNLFSVEYSVDEIRDILPGCRSISV